MSRLEGKVAVVTGANSGIGLATARLFAWEGARVFVTGRRQTELDEAVRQIGANVIGVTGDLFRLADLDQLYDIGRLGAPDEARAAALFLASDESSYVTGSELFVDGSAAQI